MSKAINFVTGNKGKIRQANICLEPLGIKVKAINLDVPEIQSHDSLKISEAKAKSAFLLMSKPIVICDFMWSINALKGFPGGYMKDMVHWFEPEDFLALMRKKTDRAVSLMETVVYYDGSLLKNFAAEYMGQITHEPRGKGNVSIDRVVIYDGQTGTIAECLDQAKPTRDLSKSAWNKFGAWYIKQV